MTAAAWANILIVPECLLAQAEAPTITVQAAVLGGLLLAAACFAAGYWLRASGNGAARAGDAPLDAGDLPDELVMVIAAAVAETLGPAHRIVRIRGLMPEDLGWQLEGRLHHHASHHPHR